MGRHLYLDANYITNSYISGVSCTKLARELNCSVRTITLILIKNNIKIRTPEESHPKGMQAGKNNPMYGKKRPDLSERNRNRNMKGENNPRWLGGLKLDKYNYCFTKKLKTEIRERDKYTCQICGKNVIGNAHVHHIDYDKQNNHPHNLITLCVKCHGMTSSGNRDNWFVELAFKQLERDIVWEGI